MAAYSLFLANRRRQSLGGASQAVGWFFYPSDHLALLTTVGARQPTCISHGVPAYNSAQEPTFPTLVN